MILYLGLIYILSRLSFSSSKMLCYLDIAALIKEEVLRGWFGWWIFVGTLNFTMGLIGLVRFGSNDRSEYFISHYPQRNAATTVEYTVYDH